MNNFVMYTIIYEKITEQNFEPEYYYAHIPTFDLTTHGFGIDGAKEAAIDLLKIWIEEKKIQGEEIPIDAESFVSKIDLQDAIYR